MQCKTLILRFRDLVTSIGDTIRLHQEIIAEHPTEAVWWGWWAKPGEQCPRDLLRLKVKISKENFLTVYLFDSGQCKLFKAKMTDISAMAGKHACPSPHNTRTPKYYAGQKYDVWFEFSEIEEVGEQVLSRFSYSDKIKDFFVEGAQFKIFENKQISSFRELQAQDRTIWFVDEFSKTMHSTHEVILSNANISVPSIFPKRPVDISNGKIVWFSDLHFDENEKYHQFNKHDYIKLDNLINEKIVSNDKVLDVEALIVSGDLTWKATKKEFESAEVFLENLCSVKKLNIDGIGICPGNHDVSFSDSYDPAVKDALEKYHEMQQGSGSLTNAEWDLLVATPVHSKSKANYEEFFKKITGVNPNEYLSMGKRYLIKNQKVVDVCFLNSNSLQQHKLAFQGQGFVGSEQLVDAEDQMGWKTNRKIKGGYRVVVLHHNLFPVNFTNVPYISAPSGLVYDTQSIFKWCFDNGVDLILHGHTHERFASKITRKFDDQNKSLWVVGLGSTGVIKEHLVGKNEFAELDFNNDRIEVVFYNITDNDIIEDEKLILD